MTSKSISAILNSKIINPTELKVTSIDGIPYEYRPICYRIFLGTVGLTTARFSKNVSSRDHKYKNYIASLFKIKKHRAQRSRKEEIELNNMKEREAFDSEGNYRNKLKQYSIDSTKFIDTMIGNTEQVDINEARLSVTTVNEMNTQAFSKFISSILNKQIAHQIEIDIKRIDKFYRTHGSTDISYMYTNILSLVAYSRPILGYIQGMADILVPFIYIFTKEDFVTAESSAYYCYLKLLDEIQDDLIALQYTQLFRLNQLLNLIDPDFFSHLKEQNLEIHIFAFRWFNCLFIREFSLKIVLRLMDSFIIFDNISFSLVAFGAALVMFFKDQLVNSDFGENVLFLQSLNTLQWGDEDIEILITTANVYKRLFLEKYSSFT